MKFTDEQVNQVKHIVHGVAVRYCANGKCYGTDMEDFELSLWEYLITKFENKSEEEFTPRLVARMCYDQAVSLYRHSKRVIMDRERHLWDNTSLDSDDSPFLQLSSKCKTGDESCFYLEILNLFDKNTKKGRKARLYIALKLYNEGLLSKEYLEDEGVSLVDGDDERSYTTKLGYNNRRISGSWIDIKKDMKKIIYDHLYDTDKVNDQNVDSVIRERVHGMLSEQKIISLKDIEEDNIISHIGVSSDIILKSFKNSSISMFKDDTGKIKVCSRKTFNKLIED